MIVKIRLSTLYFLFRRSTYKPILVSSLIGIMIIVASTTYLSNIAVYAHNFSENENALFLTLVHQIQSEIQLVQNNFPNNTKLAEQHASLAMDLLNKNDPVGNTTWTSQITERNPKVATELASSLISLKNATETKSTTTAGTNGNNINTTVARINGLLDEAISSRISHNALNNATTQALVLSNIANEIYNNYGKALGIPSARILSMAGVAMSSNGGSSNNMRATAGSNNTVIKNITDYQTAQSLAAKAQEIFNKNLKPISSSSNVAYANAQVERYLGQLKNVIDNKASFMNVMKIVHVKIHPTLISAYNLQLKS